ncbi:MAG: hypothetical protein E7572_05335 [Ruminococcaceae bacterium]|jgi:hypothetical protein|nr:hypothetical protein [Oscillospiraceae bacterium]
MGAYGSPEFLPPSSNTNGDYSPLPNPPVKKCGGLKFAYAVLLILTILFAVDSVSCFYCIYIVPGICALIPAIGFAIAAHMVHSNIDAANVANGKATGRIYRKAINGYKGNGTNVNYLNPESALAYFRYHPIKTHNAGSVIACIAVPILASVAISTTVPANISFNDMQSAAAGLVSAPAAEPAPKKSVNESEYKKQCKSYDYKDILRNPTNYSGKKVKLSGNAYQVQNLGNHFQIILQLENSNGYVLVDYNLSESGKGRVLQGDDITVYGTCDGIQQMKTTTGGTTDTVKFSAQFVDVSK